VLEALAGHGIQPQPDTPPEFLHESVGDLYRFEIKALKQRMLAGEIQKDEYASHVESLRRRYPVLGLPLRFWTE